VFGHTFRVWVTAVRSDGTSGETTVDVSPAAPTGTVGATTAGGTMLVDGQPIVPLMAWNQCASNADATIASGINLFAENPCGGLAEQLRAIGGRALSAGVAGQAGGDGPGIVGFFYPDEPDAHGTLAESLPPPPEGLPPGISLLTLTNHFYSGAAPLPNGEVVYPSLIGRADMVGFDLYPLQGWCRPERLVDVYHAQRELVLRAAGKPTFQWIEAQEMICGALGPTAVTADTVRAEAWLALVGGARGLGFFPVGWTRDVGLAIQRIAREVAALTPVLVAPEAAVSVTPGEGLVRATARSLNGATYVFAVNAGYQPARAVLQVPGLAGRTLNVLGEGRQVTAVGDQVEDGFAPLGVHLYLVPP
jgi:hypothetical protein